MKRKKNNTAPKHSRNLNEVKSNKKTNIERARKVSETVENDGKNNNRDHFNVEQTEKKKFVFSKK